MKLQRKSVQGIGLLVAGMVFHAVPMVAQQEVAPDHFDASVKQKPAVQHRKSASTPSKSAAVSHVAQGTRSKPASQPSVIVKAEAATVAVETQPR
jgi:hypothetical protein